MDDWVQWNNYYQGRVALYFNKLSLEWMVIDMDFSEQTWRFQTEASAHDFITYHLPAMTRNIVTEDLIPERQRVASVRDKVQSRYKEQT